MSILFPPLDCPKSLLSSLCYKCYMRLDKYISLSLFSINSYFVVAGILYVYCGYKLIDKIFPKFYMSIQTLCSIYSLLMYLNILLLILFCVEKYIRKKFPGLLFKMNFKDKAVRTIYQVLFYFGYYFSILNLFIFIVFMFTISIL